MRALTGGMTNAVFRCSKPGGENQTVLLRSYGKGTEVGAHAAGAPYWNMGVKKGERGPAKGHGWGKGEESSRGGHAFSGAVVGARTDIMVLGVHGCCEREERIRKLLNISTKDSRSPFAAFSLHPPVRMLPVSLACRRPFSSAARPSARRCRPRFLRAAPVGGTATDVF